LGIACERTCKSLHRPREQLHITFAYQGDVPCGSCIDAACLPIYQGLR
jgi:hypothetical protein